MQNTNHLFKSSTFIFKYMNDEHSNYFDSMFSYLHEIHAYNTREAKSNVRGTIFHEYKSHRNVVLLCEYGITYFLVPLMVTP